MAHFQFPLKSADVIVTGLNYSGGAYHITINNAANNDITNAALRCVADASTANLIQQGICTLGSVLSINTDEDGVIVQASFVKRITLHSEIESVLVKTTSTMLQKRQADDR